MEVDPVDLTDALQQGPNVIGATCSSMGRATGTWPTGKPGFLFCLDVEAADAAPSGSSPMPHGVALLARAWKPGQYKRQYLRSLQEQFDGPPLPVRLDDAGLRGWTRTGWRQ